MWMDYAYTELRLHFMACAATWLPLAQCTGLRIETRELSLHISQRLSSPNLWKQHCFKVCDIWFMHLFISGDMHVLDYHTKNLSTKRIMRQYHIIITGQPEHWQVNCSLWMEGQLLQRQGFGRSLCCVFLLFPLGLFFYEWDESRHWSESHKLSFVLPRRTLVVSVFRQKAVPLTYEVMVFLAVA